MVVSEVHGAAAVFFPGEHQRLSGLVWRGQSSVLDVMSGPLPVPSQAEAPPMKDILTCRQLHIHVPIYCLRPAAGSLMKGVWKEAG